MAITFTRNSDISPFRTDDESTLTLEDVTVTGGDTVVWMDGIDAHSDHVAIGPSIYNSVSEEISEDTKISHKFRWIKRGNTKVLQCQESGEWVDIPFIEDPDKEKYSQEINDLCSMD